MLAKQQMKQGENTGGRKRKKISDGKNSRKSIEKKESSTCKAGGSRDVSAWTPVPRRVHSDGSVGPVTDMKKEN